MFNIIRKIGLPRLCGFAHTRTEGEDAKFLLPLWCPVSGQVCTACGTLMSATQAQSVSAPVSQPVIAPASIPKSFGAKALLIILAILMMFGAIGVGGVN